jgi:hypothetical protein
MQTCLQILQAHESWNPRGKQGQENRAEIYVQREGIHMDF